MSSEPTISVFAECPAPISGGDAIVLGHGSGGKLSARLVDQVIVPALRNPILEELDDQAMIAVPGSRAAFTTDSFVVTPIFFPGGDIGTLAVNGTVNDLAMSGARPAFLSLAFILEEGFALADLERVLASVRRAADAAGVTVVTGDTKVVPRGRGDGIFINTAGIGIARRGLSLGARRIVPGDVILLSGRVGDHGVAIMSARDNLGLEGSFASDTAPLHELVEVILRGYPDVHAMRDPTRGGVGAVLVEVASRRRLGIEIEEGAIVVDDAVRGACEILGLDPLLVANEGKLIAFVPEDGADAALRAMQSHPLGRQAARIGRVTAAHPGTVVLRTTAGSQRVLDLPVGENLPRIC